MKQRKQDCMCADFESGCCGGQGGLCCSDDIKDLSKKDLLATKTMLEKQLTDVNKALGKTN